LGLTLFLTNLFVNKFDVFCEVQTVIGGQGKKLQYGWMDKRQDQQQIASWN
jgi:hypothetical protein